MDADEQAICQYLKSWQGQFVSGREISRRAAGKRRFRADPEWSAAVLARLVDKGIVESDSTGHYRLREKEKDRKPRKWLAPHIKKILEESGRNFNVVFDLDEDEAQEQDRDEGRNSAEDSSPAPPKSHRSGPATGRK